MALYDWRENRCRERYRIYDSRTGEILRLPVFFHDTVSGLTGHLATDNEGRYLIADGQPVEVWDYRNLILERLGPAEAAALPRPACRCLDTDLDTDLAERLNASVILVGGGR
jgi:hypothetical protein